MNPSPRRRWTPNDIADFAGVTTAAVSNWRRRHPDTFPQPDADGRYSPAEIRAWVGNRKAATPSDRTAALRASRAGEPLRTLERAAHEAAPGDRGLAVQAAAALVALAGLGADLRSGWPADSAILERRLRLPPGSVQFALDPGGALPGSARIALAGTVAQLALDRERAAALMDGLLSPAAGSRGSEEVLTAAALMRFLTELLPPGAQSLLDPACGLGGTLLAGAERLRPRRLVGYDSDPHAWAMTVLRCAVHGVPAAIEQRDFFTADAAGFDAVVAHPPLNMAIGRDSAARAVLDQHGFTTSQLAGDFAWLLASRDALAPGGAAFVVTAPGVGFARSGAELRHELVRTGSVSAVIALPPGLIAGTLMAVNVWVLRPAGSPPSGSGILFVTTETSGVRGHDPRTLAAAAGQVRRWLQHPARFAAVPGLSRVVPVLDVLAGDVVLAPAKWTAVRAPADEAEQRAAETLQALDAGTARLRQLPSPELSLAPGRPVELVSLADLARRGELDVQRPWHIPRSALTDDGTIPYATRIVADALMVTGHLEEAPGTSAVVTQPGDVVLSTLHPPRALVDHEGGHVLGSSLWLIRPLTDDPRLDPHLLTLLLSNPRIAAQTVGSSVRRLRRPEDVAIPMLRREDARALTEWASAVAAWSSAAADVQAAVGAAVQAVSAAVDAGASVRIPDGDIAGRADPAW